MLTDASLATPGLTLHRYGNPGATPLLLLHGLFGSGRNWQGIARRLAERRPVMVADLRNHGDSPHAAAMSYSAMADDLAALLEREAVERVIAVGHSMGGKAAMWLTLNHPRRIAAICVVDIAPVTYTSGFETLIDALLTLPLGAVTSRADADRRLAAAIPSAPIVAMSCKTCAATASTGSGAATSKASQTPARDSRFPTKWSWPIPADSTPRSS
jgi:esterase